jgi:DNA-binding response OmpR family regulator
LKLKAFQFSINMETDWLISIRRGTARSNLDQDQRTKCCLWMLTYLRLISILLSTEKHLTLLSLASSEQFFLPEQRKLLNYPTSEKERTGLFMSILLADDDVDLASFLSKSLESEGYEVHIAPDESVVLAELQRQNYKLIILDLNFGKTGGLRLLEKLRAEGITTPVIVLSARPKVSDRIQSLHLGADDYVTKPFSFQELSARVNAILRRKADPSLNILRVADLELDSVTRRAMRSGRELKLSSREFHLLHLLMRRAGTEVSRQELLHEVWGSQPGSDSNLVDVYVNYLRRKIEHFVVIRGEEKIDEENKLIHTIRGVGYRIGPEAAPAKGSGESVHPVSESGRSRGPAPISGLSRPEQISSHQTALRALVSSVAHDLAQPLTGVRCFFEVPLRLILTFMSRTRFWMFSKRS